jgi:hypothetical protein
MMRKADVSLFAFALPARAMPQEWFEGGSVWEFLPGIHYPPDRVQDFRAKIRAAANSKGISCFTRWLEDGRVIFAVNGDIPPKPRGRKGGRKRLHQKG